MKPTGTYKGEPLSPDGKKFEREFQGIPIHVDRPRGFIMEGQDEKGQPWKRTYKYDYGYIPKTKSGDDDKLDVFIGPNPKAENSYWAIQRKPDGSFDEYKIFLGFNDRDAATAVYRHHIPKKLLKGMVTIKVDMMKAMLGIGSNGYNGNMQKAAMIIGMWDELEKIGAAAGEEEEFKRTIKGLLSPRRLLQEKVMGAAKELKKDVEEAI